MRLQWSCCSSRAAIVVLQLDPSKDGVEDDVRMDSMNADSREGSCDKDQNYVTNRLPQKNVLIKGRNFEFAIGRLISRGRYGAVYE
ncbi:unnamed protein product, partial [Onchocerca ochengi]|uniref:Protein kinase domain-containing protein n=1 Tax=Onchocerca ochengi TaxID=42157 RepID=A0A182EKS3_ONCOC